MIEALAAIEKDALRDSPLHRLDARIKIIVAFSAVIAVVAFPYSTGVYLLGAVLGLIFAGAWAVSGLSVRTFLWRYSMTIPFGLFLIVFQIFFENPYYESFSPIVDLPFGIHIFAESVEFASILAVKFTLCIAWIILLSSTTPVQDMLTAGRRLGLPPVMALSLGMMIRYLFVFAGMFGRINDSLSARHFNAFDRKLPWKYRIRTLGYAIGTLFLRSYEQGERTFIAMLCRGYGKGAYEHLSKKPLSFRELVLLSAAVLSIAATTTAVWIVA